MFRIAVRRLSTSGLTKRCCKHRSLRHYSKQPEKPNLCPPPTPSPQATSGGKYTLGALALITGATLGYAKYDSDFRDWLTKQAPFTDDLIKFIFMEEDSYIGSLKKLIAAGMGIKKTTTDQGRDVQYNPPSPAFSGVKDSQDSNYKEVRLECKEEGQSEPTVTIVNQKAGASGQLPETHPKNIAELEAKIGESASHAIQWYNRAATAVKNFNHEVEVVVEYSVDRLDQKTWDQLKDKSKQKQDAIREAEQCAEIATKDIKKLKDVLSRPDVDAPEDVKKQAEKNIVKLEQDIAKAKRDYEAAVKSSSVTEKYWDKVEQARRHFIDELEILFPTIKIQDKKLQLSENDLDLFILHAFSNVLFYQKELAKTQTLGEKRLKEAISKGGAEDLVSAHVQQLLEKEKQKVFLDYEKRCLCLRNEAERELRRQLKLQSEAFADHLDEALKIREMELLREFNRKTDEKLQEEHAKYKKQLAAIVGRLKGMDQALKAQQDQERITRKAQSLWGACQALYRSIKTGCPGLPWYQQLRPLKAEIVAVKNAAAEEDELVQVVLNGIPEEAKERGVYSEDALRERFLKVEKVARQLALVPETGARLPLHILSFLQSVFLLKAANPIPQAELNDDPTDFSKLSTDDILQRARYWLDRGDFSQALKYMNLLKGASRSVAAEWMNETRILLETQQAANTLMAHAVASGLAYL